MNPTFKAFPTDNKEGISIRPPINLGYKTQDPSGERVRKNRMAQYHVVFKLSHQKYE